MYVYSGIVHSSMTFQSVSLFKFHLYLPYHLSPFFSWNFKNIKQTQKPKMKIQCDVCSKKEASVFCSADEAALCHGCDHGVHHANKLASRHQRFSLLHPPPSLTPLCDICKEKRALLFCQEDRAILCRECDLPLHSGNEYTQKHNRFLLTGIKLSEVCDFGLSGGDPVPDHFEWSRKPTSEISTLKPVFTSSGDNVTVESVEDQLVCGGSTSSISEYLIEMLPGWHFEDFEEASLGFSKSGSVSMNEFEEGDEDVLSFWDNVDVFDKRKSSSCYSTNTCSVQSENLGIWVPQAPAAAAATASVFFPNPVSGLIHEGGGMNKQQKETTVNGLKKKCRKKDDASSYTVPQIIHPSFETGSKKSRTF